MPVSGPASVHIMCLYSHSLCWRWWFGKNLAAQHRHCTAEMPAFASTHTHPCCRDCGLDPLAQHGRGQPYACSRAGRGTALRNVSPAAPQGANWSALPLLLPAGKPLEYFYRHLYLPQLGMFRALPSDLNLGKFVEPPAKPVALAFADDGGFIKNGVEYKYVCCCCACYVVS